MLGLLEQSEACKECGKKGHIMVPYKNLSEEMARKMAPFRSLYKCRNCTYVKYSTEEIKA